MQYQIFSRNNSHIKGANFYYEGDLYSSSSASMSKSEVTNGVFPVTASPKPIEILWSDIIDFSLN